MFLPELSSLTSEDIVLVMESAAMSRSFLKFLLGPWQIQRKQFLKKLTRSPAYTQLPTGKKNLCHCVTLSEGLLNIPSHAHEWVLRCVSWGGASRVRVDWCGDRPANGVAGWRAWRARTLSLKNTQAVLMTTVPLNKETVRIKWLLKQTSQALQQTWITILLLWRFSSTYRLI